jgi:hypothetical protein
VRVGPAYPIGHAFPGAPRLNWLNGSTRWGHFQCLRPCPPVRAFRVDGEAPAERRGSRGG